MAISISRQVSLLSSSTSSGRLVSYFSICDNWYVPHSSSTVDIKSTFSSMFIVHISNLLTSHVTYSPVDVIRTFTVPISVFYYYY